MTSVCRHATLAQVTKGLIKGRNVYVIRSLVD